MLCSSPGRLFLTFPLSAKSEQLPKPCRPGDSAERPPEVGASDGTGGLLRARREGRSASVWGTDTHPHPQGGSQEPNRVSEDSGCSRGYRTRRTSLTPTGRNPPGHWAGAAGVPAGGGSAPGRQPRVPRRGPSTPLPLTLQVEA